MLIREMTLQDVSAVAAIEKMCFSLPWSEQSLIDSVKREDTMFLVCEEFDEKNSDDTGDVNSNIAGYIGMYLSFDEGDITNVAVSPAHRKKGYGAALVSKAKELAKEKQLEMILLEVRVSNAPAISLYKKMGFEELGIRKNFYEHPVEDAIIMKCPL
ncbi:MAG: ribosomal protein S18-alanine N-acetyltransferase [Agathobacter sp.]|nr:ribosomal protein S18-alanine N-acetyltransferase [Agathobacter sp.]